MVGVHRWVPSKYETSVALQAMERAKQHLSPLSVVSRPQTRACSPMNQNPMPRRSLAKQRDPQQVQGTGHVPPFRNRSSRVRLR